MDCTTGGTDICGESERRGVISCVNRALDGRLLLLISHNIPTTSLFPEGIF